MKFIIGTEGYSLLNDRLNEYKQKCLLRFSKMKQIRYPKQFVDYRGRRLPGRPLKRLLVR